MCQKPRLGEAGELATSSGSIAALGGRCHALRAPQLRRSASWQVPRPPPGSAYIEGDAPTHQGLDRSEAKARVVPGVGGFAWNHEGADKRLTYSYRHQSCIGAEVARKRCALPASATGEVRVRAKMDYPTDVVCGAIVTFQKLDRMSRHFPSPALRVARRIYFAFGGRTSFQRHEPQRPLKGWLLKRDPERKTTVRRKNEPTVTNSLATVN